MKTIGEKLKKARLERGVVQRRMAKDLGLTVQSILNIENGKCFNIKTIEKYAEYIGVEIEANIVEAKN
jgi:transcriptional regulator with XRE-family HTH domain